MFFYKKSETHASGKRLVTYEYDEAGQITHMTDGAGVTTCYEYDRLGRTKRISTEQGMEVGYTYDYRNRPKGITYGNGIRTLYQYDAEGNLSKLETKHQEEVLLSLSYQYDGNGNRTEKVGKQRLAGSTSVTGKVEDPYRPVRTTYQYNVRGQLLEEKIEGDTFRYTYDASGNRIKKESKEDETKYQYNEKNQLASEEGIRGKKVFTYNHQGSILKEESSNGESSNEICNYLYNSKNQQVLAKRGEGQVQENRYDSEGLRHEMKENGILLQFLYHRGELLQETGEDIQTSYCLGAGIEGFQRDQKTYYYHQDEQLSTALITNKSGEILNHYQYDAFGSSLEKVEGVSNRIQYTNQQYDGVTGQYYLRARYYKPIIGRFLQEDVYQGDGQNLYAYCGNNPVMYYDPSGYSRAKPGCPPGAKINGDGGVKQADFIVGPNGTVVPKQIYNMSNADFVQEVANIANTKINEELIVANKSIYGHVAGSKKHSEAYNIGENYKISVQDRGLEFEQNYINNGPINNNQKGSTRLDVYDYTTSQVYDYKFKKILGNGISKSQENKIINQGPSGLTSGDIHEINPK